MSAPGPVPSGSRAARRERLVGLLVLGVALVLLVSSVTWFASDRAGIGVGQLLLAVVLAAVGGFLVRRRGRPCPAVRPGGPAGPRLRPPVTPTTLATTGARRTEDR